MNSKNTRSKAITELINNESFGHIFRREIISVLLGVALLIDPVRKVALYIVLSPIVSLYAAYEILMSKIRGDLNSKVYRIDFAYSKSDGELDDEFNNNKDDSTLNSVDNLIDKLSTKGLHCTDRDRKLIYILVKGLLNRIYSTAVISLIATNSMLITSKRPINLSKFTDLGNIEVKVIGVASTNKELKALLS
jgi:hypothetical protein